MIQVDSMNNTAHAVITEGIWAGSFLDIYKSQDNDNSQSKFYSALLWKLIKIAPSSIEVPELV